MNIHIGSLEINEKLDKTPTDQVKVKYFERTKCLYRKSTGYGIVSEVLLKLNILILQNDQRQHRKVLEMSLYFLKVLGQHLLQVILDNVCSVSIGYDLDDYKPFYY